MKSNGFANYSTTTRDEKGEYYFDIVMMGPERRWRCC